MLRMARKSPFVSMGGIHSNETTVREPPSPPRNNIGGNQEADDERCEMVGQWGNHPSDSIDMVLTWSRGRNPTQTVKHKLEVVPPT